LPLGDSRPDQHAVPLDPSRRRAGRAEFGGGIKANAKIQAGLLATASPVLAEQIKNNQLKVVAAYYDLASGAESLAQIRSRAGMGRSTTSSGLLRFARNDSPDCHCEERSDEAISLGKCR